MSEIPVIDSGLAKIPDLAKFPKTTSCRERFTFPWQGRLTRTVSDLPAGTLVAVTGKEGKSFSVRVGRVQDKPAGPERTVGQEYVDEAVASVIEDVLLYKMAVCWSDRRAWREGPYAAIKEFEISEWVAEGEAGPPEAGPPEPGSPEPARRLVKAGERFGGMDHSKESEGYFLADKDGVIYKVPCGMLEINPKIPRLSSGITFLCYEFGMYAAALAGLFPNFVEVAISEPGKLDRSSYWVMRTGGAVDTATKFGPGKLDSLPLQRGDIVLFYGSDETLTSEHTAVATGDAQGVYSLWEAQDDYVHPRLTTVQDLFKVRINKSDDVPFTCVRIGTPGWHLKPGS